MFCARIDIEPFVPCQWKWLWTLALGMESYNILDFTSCAPSGSQMYWQTHIRNITCQYCYNICSHTLLTATHCWGRLWWANETQCYHFVLKRKWAGMKWRHPASSQLKTFLSQASAGKAMTSMNPFFCTSNHVITQSAQTICLKLFESCTPT